MRKKIGIIGGSGLDNPDILQSPAVRAVDTPWGAPSSALTCGRIGETEVAILARHGVDHGVAPSRVNYRANIRALKDEGCALVLAVTAVGSLREEIRPGNLAFPSQFIDFTRHRNGTFFDDRVVHTPMSDPFHTPARDVLCAVCGELGLPFNRDVTVVTIEGPRFSTRAESRMFRAWGADIINMSTCPEVILANELGLPYQAIAMSTDYDCWKDDEPPVTYEIVMDRMRENAEHVRRLLTAAIPRL